MVMPIAAIRTVVVLFWGDEEELGPPRFLRIASSSDIGGGRRRFRVEWQAPASWGPDREGAGQRSYTVNERQTLNSNGTPHTGANAPWGGAPVPEAGPLERTISAEENEVWEVRVRANNRIGEHSEYRTIEIHFVEQSGFLLMDRRFLRFYDGTNWRRARLV